MNHAYAEAGVKREENAASLALRSLVIFGMVVGVILMLIGGLFSIVGIALVVVLGFLYPRLSVEYEYVYVDGQLDFDRITGKAKRKTMLRVDFDQVEAVAPANSHSLDEYKNGQFETKNFASGSKESKPYVVVAKVNDKRMKIFFEPSEKMVDLMKQKAPRKVTTY
ncbi:MAG TPA: hypothetical protein GXZ21_11500 [Clostridiales bacterium]|nr:hypothetical protein [Clostridiales bacterium]